MPRINEWSDRLRRTLSGNYSREDIEDFVRDLVMDCKDFVERDQHLQLPPFELYLCDDEQFQQLLRSLPPRNYAYEPIAITVGRGPDRLIAINVGKLLLLLQNENPDQTFVLNLTLAAIEELIHAARPDLSETQVNGMVNDLGERYLGVTIPRAVREHLARVVAENEASNKRRNQA